MNSSQFLKLLSDEAKMMGESLEACGVRVTHVTDYITDLKALARAYDRVSASVKCAFTHLTPPLPPSLPPFPCHRQ